MPLKHELCIHDMEVVSSIFSRFNYFIPKLTFVRVYRTPAVNQ